LLNIGKNLFFYVFLTVMLVTCLVQSSRLDDYGREDSSRGVANTSAFANNNFWSEPPEDCKQGASGGECKSVEWRAPLLMKNMVIM
jgi:hypothetical protein